MEWNTESQTCLHQSVWFTNRKVFIIYLEFWTLRWNLTKMGIYIIWAWPTGCTKLHVPCSLVRFEYWVSLSSRASSDGGDAGAKRSITRIWKFQIYTIRILRKKAESNHNKWSKIIFINRAAFKIYAEIQILSLCLWMQNRYTYIDLIPVEEKPNVMGVSYMGVSTVPMQVTWVLFPKLVLW